METADWIITGGLAASLALLWNLHCGVAHLRERMAKLEGAFDLLAKSMMARNRPASGGAD